MDHPAIHVPHCRYHKLTKVLDPRYRMHVGWHSLEAALMQAIRTGNECLAIELADKDAEPDTKDIWESALMQARRGGLKKVERRLLCT